MWISGTTTDTCTNDGGMEGVMQQEANGRRGKTRKENGMNFFIRHKARSWSLEMISNYLTWTKISSKHYDIIYYCLDVAGPFSTLAIWQPCKATSLDIFFNWSLSWNELFLLFARQFYQTIQSLFFLYLSKDLSLLRVPCALGALLNGSPYKCLNTIHYTIQYYSTQYNTIRKYLFKLTHRPQ